VERTPLIKHSGPRQTQEELTRQQNQERSHSNAENQTFLKDVTNQVLAGEGVGWLKLNRFKKLMEDESYRTLVLSKLNKTLDKKIAPDDHIDDVVSLKYLGYSSSRLTPSCILAVRDEARVEGYAEVHPGHSRRVGRDLCEFRPRRYGFCFPADGGSPHALLEQGDQRGQRHVLEPALQSRRQSHGQ